MQKFISKSRLNKCLSFLSLIFHQDLKSHATDLVSQCEDVTAVGDRVVSSTSVEDANKIQTDLQRCQDTLRSLHVATNKMEEDFKLAKRDLLEYREVRDELLDWLNVKEEKLKNTVANMDLSSVDQGNTEVQVGLPCCYYLL